MFISYLQLFHTTCDTIVRPAIADLSPIPLFVGGTSLADVVSEIEHLIRSAVGGGVSDEQFKASLEAGNVPEKVLADFLVVYQSRKAELVASLLKSAVKVSAAYLKDFDWSIRMVLGTNKLSTTKKSVMLLTLTVADVQGNNHMRTYELDADGLKQVIETLEQVSASTRKLIVP